MYLQCKFLRKNTPTLPSYPYFLFIFFLLSPDPPAFFLIPFHPPLPLKKQRYFCGNGNIL